MSVFDQTHTKRLNLAAEVLLRAMVAATKDTDRLQEAEQRLVEFMQLLGYQVS